MPVREILMLGNPALRKIADEETDFKGVIDEISKDLKDTLHNLQNQKKTGQGLSATQIGINKRVIYIDTLERKLILINPKIMWKSLEINEIWESSFSFDMTFYVKIKRHVSIQVKYQNIKRETIIEKFTGLLSELVQHQIDHLDGILAIDYLEDKKNIVMASEYKKQIL